MLLHNLFWYFEMLVLLTIQSVLLLISVLMNKAVKKSIDYHLTKIRSGRIIINKKQAICLLVKYLGTSLLELIFITFIALTIFTMVEHLRYIR